MKTAKYICERCRHYNGSGLSCVECEKGSKFVKFADSANYKDPDRFTERSRTRIVEGFQAGVFDVAKRLDLIVASQYESSRNTINFAFCDYRTGKNTRSSIVIDECNTSTFGTLKKHLINYFERDPNKFMTPINYSFDDARDIDSSKELAMVAKNMLNSKYGYSNMNRRNIEITKVIFNDPATIVFWSDGKKTVVRTQNGDQFDPEKGLAMAISKRVLGNEGNYYEEFKRWLPEESEEVIQTTSNPFSELASRISVVDLFNHD